MPRRRLSCCEYINRKGEAAHVLGCCCDCDVIDTACDRCLRCQSQNPDFLGQMASVIADRMRIPWFGGAGAIQLQLDAFTPILIIPTLLVISITHYYVAWSVSLFTPLCLVCYYRCWRSNPQRHRTRFFFSWGLVSTFTMAYVFFGAAITYREIYLVEGLMMFALLVLMLYSLYLTKQDPGSIRQDGPHDAYMRVVNFPKGKLNARGHHLSTMHPSLSISRQVNEKLNDLERDQMTVISPRTDDGSGSSPRLEGGDYIGVPSLLPSHLNTHSAHSKEQNKPGPAICEKCNIRQPDRSSHCNVCHQCYSVRDHHCIWLDQCIGLRNHRAFIVTISLFLVVSMYGLHLTLTTICTPIMVLDYFLVPVNCRYVYADLLGAIAYVSCCYTAVSISLVLMLFIQQLILISQNATIQEFNKSIRQHTERQTPRRWWQTFYIADNPYNRGFRNNWLTFFRRTRHEPPRPNQLGEEDVE